MHTITVSLQSNICEYFLWDVGRNRLYMVGGYNSSGDTYLETFVDTNEDYSIAIL